MYEDPEGQFGTIASVLIGAIVGAIIGATISMYQDFKDDGSLNGSIGGWAYAGSILGGAIAGCGQGFVSTVLLGMAGSITNSIVSSGFNPKWDDMVTDCIMAGVLSAVGYGIGQTIRYGFDALEAKGLKALAKWKGNNFVNHLLKKMELGVNIGMKNTNKIANALFNSKGDILGIGVEAFSSSIPDIIKTIFE